MILRPSLSELSSMFDHFNEEHFHGEIPKIPVVINERLTSTAGRAFCKVRMEWSLVTREGGNAYEERVNVRVPTKIELSGPIFDHHGWDFHRPSWPMNELDNILVHEMTHAYLFDVFNERGHSVHFHNIMSKITGVVGNHRYHYMDVHMVTANKKVRPVKKGRVSGGISLNMLG